MVGQRQEDTQEKPEMLGTHALRERGWTPALIARFLGDADATRPNPFYASSPPMRLYSLARVEDVEADPAFMAAQVGACRRVEAGKAAAIKKAAKLVEEARTTRIRVKRLDDGEVLMAAIDAYNERQSERSWERGYGGWEEARPDSEPDFLARITVNYIRHNLTTYDTHLERVAGRTGVHQAVDVIRERLYDAITEAYPHHGAECRRQLERRRQEQGR